MGNVFSFFKKPKGTREQLEELENEIDKIEEYRISALVRERNCNALLIVSSVIIYFIGLIYLYFDYDNTKSIAYKALCLCFLIAVPLIVYYARNLVGWYYTWVKETNDIKRVALLKLKKKILSKVQETETFNDARMILERYDPSALRNMSVSLNNLSNLDRDTPVANRPSSYRQAAFQPHNTPRIMSPLSRPAAPLNPMGGGGGPIAANLVSFSTPAAHYAATPRQPLSRTVKPILAQNRSIIEKAVDYLFADGPSNRYALICVRCFAHNGMALQDEFEYISYICAYCGTFNPARKIRPNAPKVDFTMKAIEGPKVDEAEEDARGSEVGPKITEISSELNKTADTQRHQVEETNEHDDSTKATTSTAAETSSTSSIAAAATEPIPFADAEESDAEEDGDQNKGDSSTT